MLFWAGLRGAVGFALSAGIEGQNAIALQTTVLVAVVLTVIVFGGTTAQMLQILGIRTGVQDDGEDSDEEEEENEMRLRSMRRGSYGRVVGKYTDRYEDESVSSVGDGSTPPRHPYTGAGSAGAGFGGAGGGPSRLRSASTYSLGGGVGGLGSEPEEDVRSSTSSDVLPSTHSAAASGPGTDGLLPSGPGAPLAALGAELESHGGAGGSARQLLDRAGLIMRDGQWFQRIDERYLLPMFSNSVASRKHEARKSARMAHQAQAQAQAASEGIAGGAGGATGAGAGVGDVPNERDAEITLGEGDDDDDDDEDDEEGGFAIGSGRARAKGNQRQLSLQSVNANSSSSLSRSGSGSRSRSSISISTSTPTRRTASRTASDDEDDAGAVAESGPNELNSGAAPPASRLSGAFRPRDSRSGHGRGGGGGPGAGSGAARTGSGGNGSGNLVDFWRERSPRVD